jgi:hypothetical protein
VLSQAAFLQQPLDVLVNRTSGSQPHDVPQLGVGWSVSVFQAVLFNGEQDLLLSIG